MYVDNGIFIGDSDNQIMEIIAQLQSLGLKIEDQGHPADYVGVNIKSLKGGGIEFTQRALIDSIIEDDGLKGTIANQCLQRRMSYCLLTRTNQDLHWILTTDLSLVS